MLKKIMNRSEAITHKQVQEICQKYNALVHAKVRLADIFPIEGSGIPNELYSFALTSHFDVIVTDEETNPLFAIEFDGVLHSQSQRQIERDKKKDALCERFNLPLLRITSEYLSTEYRKMNLLTWFIETWFAFQWFKEAQEKGELDYYEPFMPMSFAHIPGHDKEFPLWLSRDVRGRIAKLNHDGLIEDMAPSGLVWQDRQSKEYHCIAWVVIDENRAVLSTADMKGQNFPVPIADVLEDITVVQLYNVLTQTLNNELNAVSPETVNQVISEMKLKYGHIVFGGSFSHLKIKI
jgi:hypothetical protein